MDLKDSLIELFIWREARGGTSDDWQGILSVARNRLAASYLGANTLAEVILRKYQFSSFNWNDVNSTKFPRSADVPGWKAWQAIQKLVAADLTDNTNGANHYCNKGLATSWNKGVEPCAHTSSFDFYNVP
jgi:hypothetical protein